MDRANCIAVVRTSPCLTPPPPSYIHQQRMWLLKRYHLRVPRMENNQIGRCKLFLSTVLGIQADSLEKRIDKLHFRPQCLWLSSLTPQWKSAEKVRMETGPEPELGVWNPPYHLHSLFNQPAKGHRLPHRGNSESTESCWKGPYWVLGSQNDGRMARHSVRSKWALLSAAGEGNISWARALMPGSKNTVQASRRTQGITVLWEASTLSKIFFPPPATCL